MVVFISLLVCFVALQYSTAKCVVYRFILLALSEFRFLSSGAWAGCNSWKKFSEAIDPALMYTQY